MKAGFDKNLGIFVLVNFDTVDALCSGYQVIYVFELLLIQESKILIINYTCLLFTYLLKLFKKILRFISLKRRNIFFQKIP